MFVRKRQTVLTDALGATGKPPKRNIGFNDCTSSPEPKLVKAQGLFFLSKGKTFREDKEALPYGVGARTFLPSGFPLSNPFPFTYLLPAPTQYFVQMASACKTMLDRARIYAISYGYYCRSVFSFVSLTGLDWRRQRRRRAMF